MIDFSKILFLDIETVSQKKSYEQLNERMQKLWDKKADQLNRDNAETTPAEIYDRAAIYPSPFCSWVPSFLKSF